MRRKHRYRSSVATKIIAYYYLEHEIHCFYNSSLWNVLLFHSQLKDTNDDATVFNIVARIEDQQLLQHSEYLDDPANDEDPADEDDPFEGLSPTPSEQAKERAVRQQVLVNLENTEEVCKVVMVEPDLQRIVKGVHSVFERSRVALMTAPTLMQHFADGHR